jgi:surface protein
MKSMVFGKKEFNKDLSSWNTENVTKIAFMFQDVSSFDNGGQDLSWNVSNVTNMQSMFQDASNFDSNIGNWNTENVTYMHSMFENAK